MTLPFTADASQGLSAFQTRFHWVGVLAAESTGCPNNHWEFQQEFLRSINGAREKRPSALGKFIMIDTAISGQAAVDITTAMDEWGLDYRLILLVDDNGKRLRPQFRRQLDANGRVHQIPLNRIYTEDRGAALMGMTTALFPARTKGAFVASLQADLPFKAIFYGLHRDAPIRDPSQYFSYVHALHFYATKVVLGKEFSGEDEQAVEYFRTRLQADEQLAGPDSSLRLCKLFGKLGRIEITGSLSVRVIERAL